MTGKFVQQTLKQSKNNLNPNETTKTRKKNFRLQKPEKLYVASDLHIRRFVRKIIMCA